VDPGKQAQFCRVVAHLLVELAESLEAEEPAPPVTSDGGRPPKEPSPELVAEVLRLKHANGRLGRRPLAEMTGATEHMIRRILRDYVLGENPHEVG
jgi:hypothetical protein